MVKIAVIVPALVSFVISAIAGYFLVPYLTKKKMDQTEREEGVASHLKKNGTPTMGGLMFLLGITITCLIFEVRFHKILPVLFLTLAFGGIGFYDDYLKVIKKRSDGLFPKQKLLAQIIVTAVFLLLLYLTKTPLSLRVPFSGGKFWEIGWLAVPLAFLAVIGTVNGVNFTDGLDGLSSTVTLFVAAFMTIAALMTDTPITPATAAVFGGLLAFLLFNAYPAKIFMGDTGSLALGGFVAGAAYMMQMPLFILIVGLIYLVEVLSVMIQVSYFKATHGKRIFRMAPIHHHFELGGMSETKVVACFAVTTAVLCLIGVLAI